MIPWLESGDPFPPVEEALRDPNGLLAAGDDLSTPRLLQAYEHGIFPWFGDGDPVLWWSPDPRMVLATDAMRVSRSLRKTIRAGRFRVTADTAFPQVIAACAEPRPDQDGTWITSAVFDAYCALAAMGVAHSIEAWDGDTLAGGLYGVALGRMFFGESMFARRSDASKVALVHLVRQLRRWGFPLIDCQMSTSHLASLGARTVSRAEFLAVVRRCVGEPPVLSPWRLDADLAEE
ncbi:MAG TPA: leucyl/phenylalanyl-tRNA--protein transferase [Vicinamibacterales bacterium]|jgi:leucyl/phenylalanyl-tRNA--protein transferase|nr:leucyl/phenylalanyl-tRNA--protein transferase [Vicinamibacterales bacterium]